MYHSYKDCSSTYQNVTLHNTTKQPSAHHISTTQTSAEQLFRQYVPTLQSFSHSPTPSPHIHMHHSFKQHNPTNSSSMHHSPLYHNLKQPDDTNEGCSWIFCPAPRSTQAYRWASSPSWVICGFLSRLVEGLGMGGLFRNQRTPRFMFAS